MNGMQPRSRRRDRRASFARTSLLIGAVLAAASWSGAASAAACFRYGEVVTLSGQYFTEVAPAADGVVRAPLQDAARRADILFLNTPYCVDADVLSGGVSAASEIQLHCPATGAADGSVLSLTGRLFGAHTGNGHTPVLLACQH